MELPNDIVLRPRFSLDLPLPPETILHYFEGESSKASDFVISRIDDHVFIRIPKHKQHFWSPQLHLEIYQIEQQPTVLKGLFGPSPTVWTLFMFLHFAVVLLFIAAGVWLYTQVSLGDTYVAPLIAMILLILVWIVLYVAGRLGKRAGYKEMISLQTYMYLILNQTLSTANTTAN
ncbi:MAG: GTP-binding protein [Cytophagaceae bacterium]|nr:GTP-binding protein [Cytophagaceae bacterium]